MSLERVAERSPEAPAADYVDSSKSAVPPTLEETSAPPRTLELRAETAAQMRDLGANLALHARAGDALFLNGHLAAGKTTLARGFIRTFFNDPALDVPSPSYLICLAYEDERHEHHAERGPTAAGEPAADATKPARTRRAIGRTARLPGVRVLHLDPYRLPEGRVASLVDVSAALQRDVCLIEWPERLGRGLVTESSPPRLEVTLGGVGPQAQGRTVTLRAVGARWEEAISRWAAAGSEALLRPPPCDEDGERGSEADATIGVAPKEAAAAPAAVLAHRPAAVAPPDNSSAESLLVLGIESSCDDTGAAVVRGDGTVIGEALASQAGVHERWGGVKPSEAQAAHRRAIDETVELALSRAGVAASALSAVAVTVGPGLSLCLEVGVKKALALCQQHRLPMLRVHHMEAHAMVAWIPRPPPPTSAPAAATAASLPPASSDDGQPPFPFLTLLISGGHNMLVLTRGLGDHRILGATLDDSIGEAFDKTARLLGISQIPGGPALEKLAAAGDAATHDLPQPLSKTRDMALRNSCDFSYSGLKSAVRLLIERNLSEETLSTMTAAGREAARANVAAAFQLVSVEHLCERTARAILWARGEAPALSALVVAGGVAANALVRQRLSAVAAAAKLPLVLPPPRLCVDNGVMVAWAGMLRFRLGLGEEPLASTDDVDLHIEVRPRWPLGPRDSRSVTQLQQIGKSSKKRRLETASR